MEWDLSQFLGAGTALLPWFWDEKVTNPVLELSRRQLDQISPSATAQHPSRRGLSHPPLINRRVDPEATGSNHRDAGIFETNKAGQLSPAPSVAPDIQLHILPLCRNYRQLAHQ